jgi:sec-independent protein translocase protein TatA
MGPVGVPEMFAIFVIALLLFGPKKLPELGRTLGKALSEFRRAKNELKGTFESHLRELERETNMSDISSSSTSSYSSQYSYPYEDYNQYNPESPDYSNPSPVGGTDENRAALPAPEEASHVEHAACEHQTLPQAEAVSGTVARSNGVRPLDENVEAARTEHHAPQREEHPV